MADINRHIREYLTYYLALPSNVGFAVLLNGEWGCGKTWFIRQYISDYHKDHSGNLRFLYISLYGVTKTAEIEDQIFQQLHPILSSKPLMLTGRILKGVLRASLKVDLSDNTVKSSASISPDLKDSKFPEYLKKTDDCVMVFDDLERCQMTAPLILGYINSFVEHDGSKVIIIANETELDSKEASYRRIKEKLVGKTFKVLHDVESALESFLEQLQTVDARAYLRKRSSEIGKVLNTAGYQNLRHMNRSFLDFEKLFNTLSETHKNLPGFLDDLLPVFFSLSFEIQAGALRPSDINGFMETAIGYAFRKTDDQNVEKPPLARLIEKYDLDTTSKLILPESCWISFFDKGFVSTIELSAAVDQTIYAQTENTPAWIKLWHYAHLNDEDFVRLIGQLSEQWQQGAFRIPGEILHVCGLFLRFSELGLYPKSLAETLQNCKQYINKISDSWTKEELDIHARNQRHDTGSHLGFGYTSYELLIFINYSDTH